MDLLREKKGTTMVEAAIIFPLIILSVMAMIYLLVNIYSTIALQSHMHLLLREDSGISNGMVLYEVVDDYKRDKIRRKAEKANIDIKKAGDGSSKYVEAQKDSLYATNTIIRTRPKVRSYGRYFLYSESDIVRFNSIVTNN